MEDGDLIGLEDVQVMWQYLIIQYTDVSVYSNWNGDIHVRLRCFDSK